MLAQEISDKCTTIRQSVFPKRLFKFGRGLNSNQASHSCFLSWLADVLSDKIWSWDSEAAGSVVIVLGLSELCGVSSVSITSGLRSDSDDSGVDGARNAVLLLEIDFWEMEVLWWVSAVIFDIFSGGLIHKLSHGKSLDGLIFGNLSVAVEADHTVRVSLIFLTSSVVSSL